MSISITALPIRAITSTSISRNIILRHIFINTPSIADSDNNVANIIHLILKFLLEVKEY